nr:type II toxin-antitoxin system HicA family toxin [Aurantimonas sp. VKM B-3413]
MTVRRRHRRTLEQVFARPVIGSIRWSDIEALLRELGAEIEEREGSRIGIVMFGEIRVFHRPHPTPDTDKSAVVAVRKWLEANGIKP